MGDEDHLPTVEEWEWDEDNIAELASHGVEIETVYQIAEEAPLFKRNKRGRGATHQMVGTDRGGAVWVICVRPVPGKEALWRAITGWRAEEPAVQWYRRHK